MERSQEPRICRTTVLDESFPGISFDSSGQATQVSDFLARVQPIWRKEEADKAQLLRLKQRIRRRAGSSEYDSILGFSGGLDSSYMLHFVVRELGLRPLVFHVDGGWNSETAVHNIRSMVDGLGLDLFTEVINWSEMRDFQLAFFRSGVPHLDIPQDHAFVAALYNFAAKHGIRTILNGGNVSTEGVRNPLLYFYYGTDMKQLRSILDRFGPGKLPTFPFSSALRHKGFLRVAKGIEVVKVLNHTRFRKAEAEALLGQEYGWRSYPQKHFESRFTRFFEGYWLPTRFNFDPRTVQFSSLILTGQLSRQEALRALELPPLTESEAIREFGFIADKLEIGVDELTSFLESPKKYFYDYPNSRSLFQVGAQVLNFIGEEKSLKT